MVVTIAGRSFGAAGTWAVGCPVDVVDVVVVVVVSVVLVVVVEDVLLVIDSVVEDDVVV